MGKAVLEGQAPIVHPGFHCPHVTIRKMNLQKCMIQKEDFPAEQQIRPLSWN